MPDSLWPHGLQHIRLLCPPISPRVSSYSCPLSQWCHPTISFSTIPFSFCLQSFPSSQGLFQWISSFVSSGQSIGTGALVTVLPINIRGWFPLGLTGLISLHFKGLSRVFSNTTVEKHQFFSTSLWPSTSIDDYWENHSFDYMDLCQQNISAF